MPQIKLIRQTLIDRKGRLGKIKALMLAEAEEKVDMPLPRALVMVSNDISAIVIDCIERIHCGDCLFARSELMKGGDGD